MSKSRKSVSPFRRAKFRVLGHLPGAAGRRYRRKYRRSFQAENEAAFLAALKQTAGMTAIDLGANVGEVTTTMAAHAGRVIAFEPDPWTANKLRAATEGLPNVEVIEAAAGAEDGTVQFYRHADFLDNPDKHSESSSMVAEKINIDTATKIDVQAIDFVEFLDALDGEVGVLKIDIEGGEVALLEHLLPAPCLDKVHFIFCETHEIMIPGLERRTAALRAKAATVAHPQINLNWH